MLVKALVYGVDLAVSPNNPFWSSLLDEMGLKQIPLSSLEQVPIIVIEMPSKLSTRLRRELRQNTSVLVRVEPRSVNPRQYSSIAHKLFDRVLTPTSASKTRIDEEAYDLTLLSNEFKLDSTPISRKNWEKRDFDVALLFRPKVSFIRGSWYHLRPVLVKKFLDSKFRVGLGGPGWFDFSVYVKEHLQAIRAAVLSGVPLASRRHIWISKPKSIDYFGFVRDPISFLSKARFSVVIENEGTYVSEKIFTSLQAGAIPIYFCSDETSLGQLERFIIRLPIPAEQNLKDLDVDSLTLTHEFFRKYEAYLNWLKGEESVPWLVSQYRERVGCKLSAALEGLTE